MYSLALSALALVPAIMLVLYVNKKDRAEKEPVGLLAFVFFCGAITFFFDGYLELMGKELVSKFFEPGSVLNTFIYKFFVVGLLEEFGKFAVVMLLTWKNKSFNYTFDAVVYAVTSSMGFAALENYLYVMDGGLVLGITRAFITVTSHAAFGVFMGMHIGMAKYKAVNHSGKGTAGLLIRAVLVTMALHGFFDFCLNLNTTESLMIFFVYEIVLFVLAIKNINRMSKNDVYIFERSFIPTN